MDFEITDHLDLLSRTPTVLRHMLTTLPPRWAHCTESPESWSPHQVVAHLLHEETVNWIPRARAILESASTPTLPEIRATVGDLDDREPLDALLEEFASARIESVAQLRSWNLSAVDLQRTAIHRTLGRVHLRELLAAWLAHDMTHQVQIIRTLAHQFRAHTGPWQTTMRILR